MALFNKQNVLGIRLMSAWIIIALDDDFKYKQAVRRIYYDKLEAETYCDRAIAATRHPIVVALPDSYMAEIGTKSNN